MIPFLIILGIIGITIICCYIAKLRYDYKMSYVDEPIESGTYRNRFTKEVTSTWTKYKRTYKNGTITYIEKEFGQ